MTKNQAPRKRGKVSKPAGTKKPGKIGKAASVEIMFILKTLSAAVLLLTDIVKIVGGF